MLRFFSRPCMTFTPYSEPSPSKVVTANKVFSWPYKRLGEGNEKCLPSNWYKCIQMQVQYFRGIPRTAIARKHRTASEPSNPRACGCWAWGALRLTRKMLKVCWCLLSCVWRRGNAATHFFMRYKHIIGEANTLDPWLFKSWPFANQNHNLLKKMEADRIYRYH